MKDRYQTWSLTTRLIGRHTRVYDTLESTNTLALALGGELTTEEGLVVLAREQTAGRGQHGRTWSSPPEASLLLSVLLRPPDAVRRPVLMTALAAVAVCETIGHTTGLCASIKWPNDVLIDGKKVCGILIEQRGATVIGIGLNLQQSRRWFREAGLTQATSLFAETRKKPSLSTVWACLCHQLDRDYRRLLNGKPRSLEIRWQRMLGLKGKTVLAETHQGDMAGVVRRIAFDSIQLEVDGGEVVTFLPEAIRHLTPLATSE